VHIVTEGVLPIKLNRNPSQDEKPPTDPRRLKYQEKLKNEIIELEKVSSNFGKQTKPEKAKAYNKMTASEKLKKQEELLKRVRNKNIKAANHASLMTASSPVQKKPMSPPTLPPPSPAPSRDKGSPERASLFR